ncbi:hypothetical protein ACNOYE_30720 [Nannocystaceae bacterium ST9]
MKVKGTFFIARREALTREFGERAWSELLADLAAESGTFARIVTPTSMVEIGEYLRFQAAILRRFYADDLRAYWKVGLSAGRWALTEGPYRHLVSRTGDVDGSLAAILPRLWKINIDAGDLHYRREGDVVTLTIDGVDTWHAALELTTMGYAQATLELITGREVTASCVTGHAQGSLGCVYEFRLS